MHPRDAARRHARRPKNQGSHQRRAAVSLVLDASLTLSWYFDDERTADADALLDQVADHGACVPSLWPRSLQPSLMAPSTIVL